MSPEQRRLRRISIAAMTPEGHELLAHQGLLPAPLTPKPSTGSAGARSIAAGMDAWWPKGGTR